MGETEGPSAGTRPGTWVQLSRKIFISLDPRTGEMLKGPDRDPLRPIAWPFQVKKYTLQGGEISHEVESHDTAPVFSEPLRMNYTVTEIGRVRHYKYSMLIDRVRVDATRSRRFKVNDLRIVLSIDPPPVEACCRGSRHGQRR